MVLGSWYVPGKLPHKPSDPGSAWEPNQGSAKIALSGAVYVYVDGKGFWKPSAVPAIVQGFKQSLEKVMEPETGDGEEPGTHQTAMTLWDSQKDLLKQRVDQVMRIYDRLVAQARMAMEKR